MLVALATATPWAVAGDVPVPVKRPDAGTPPVSSAPPPTVLDRPQAPAAPVAHRGACPALLSGRIEARPAPALREGDCGEDSPLVLERASGIGFPGKPLVNCEMAGEMAGLAELADLKAREILGGELAEILTGPGYECRRRNRAADGKLSEHAFANALDIAGFRLADGRQVMIGPDWPRSQAPAQAGEVEDQPPPPAERAGTPEAKYLAEVHAAACRRFTTVLSPDSDSAHESHLHFDLGCHGRDCRYLICE